MMACSRILKRARLCYEAGIYILMSREALEVNSDSIEVAWEVAPPLKTQLFVKFSGLSPIDKKTPVQRSSRLQMEAALWHCDIGFPLNPL